MSVKISILGIPQTMAFLKLKAKNIDKQTTDSMKKIGRHMQNEVKSSISGHEAEPTSVDTGKFLSSIDFNAASQSVVIFSDVSYAFNYYGGKIFPSNPTLGIILICIALFIIIFTDTFIKIYSKRKKIKLKEKFK